MLKSSNTLQLDKGATLVGSADHRVYPPRTEFREPGLQSLVSATSEIAGGASDIRAERIHFKERTTVFE